MIEKQNAGKLLLAAFTAVALYFCYLLFRPYATPILFASVIAIVFYPLHRYTLRIVRWPSVSALISTIVTIVLSIVPLALLLPAISNELARLYQSLAARSADAGGIIAYLLHGAEKIAAWAGQVFPVPAVDLHAVIMHQLESASAALVRLGTNLVGNIFSFLTDAVIAFVILFFLYRDGEAAITRMMAALPLPENRLSELRTRIGSAVVANFYGGIVVGAFQGVLTGLSFWALGIGSPVLWGVVTGVFSLVPIVGSAAVWVPASIALLLTGHYLKAIILLALGTAVIGSVDNIVRPLIIGKSVRLHAIFVFFALLGGVQLFGVLGLFVGPVVLSVTAALLTMLREDLSDRHPEHLL
jgi:predicted PurR-regulated permease PerM